MTQFDRSYDFLLGSTVTTVLSCIVYDKFDFENYAPSNPITRSLKLIPFVSLPVVSY